MRTVPRSRLEFILAAHPNAMVSEDETTVTIPTYDIDTDTAGTVTLQIVDDPPNTKPQPGELRRDRFGNMFKIVDLGTVKFPIRKGPKAEWND